MYGIKQEVDDEAGNVLGDDGRFAKGRGEGAQVFNGGVAGGDGAHDLDELHDGDGVEEVQPGDARLATGNGGHLHDGQRGGIAGDDAARGDDAVEGPEELLLLVEILDDGLDDEIAVAEVGHVERAPDAPAIFGGLIFCDLALAGEHLPCAVDACHALVEQVLVDLGQHNIITGLGGALGNAAAHQAAADDAYLLNRH